MVKQQNNSYILLKRFGVNTFCYQTKEWDKNILDKNIFT